MPTIRASKIARFVCVTARREGDVSIFLSEAATAQSEK